MKQEEADESPADSHEKEGRESKMKLQLITPAQPIICPKLWKEFEAAPVKKATLRITGLGLYRAFLNGRRVGQDWLTPGFNDYDAYLRWQEYDVTELLREQNRLEVWLGNGWYRGRLGFDGGKSCRWGSRYLLAARLEMETEDGRTLALETDGSWLAEASPIVDGGIYDGEIRDDTRPGGTPVPCVPADNEYRLEAQFSPCIRVRTERKPVLIRTPAGEQVLDFGQNMAGVIRFVNRLPRGKTLRIQTGEVLQGGNFYRDNLRTAKSEFVYTSDGQEKEVEPLFTFFGFRYARVEGLEKVDPADYTALCLSSALRETLEVHTSHEKLNRLMENSLWGQRSNFLDVPTDCPQRDERLGWTADTQVFVNTACYQMDCREFYRKYMRDLREDQQRYYQGDLPAYSPSLQGEAIHGGAVWADAGTIIPWHVYQNYGDLSLLRESYPMMRDYTETLIAADRAAGGTHLVFRSFTFGDWLAQDGMGPQSLKGGTEDAFIQGVYYMHSVELTGKAAGEIGAREDRDRYGALAEEIREALRAEYLTPGGRLAVDTQTAYVLALHFGLYRNREKLLQGFRRRLERDFYRITCGFTGAPLMLPVLLDNGMTDIAYRMLLTEEFPGWLYAVNLGATTIWERWNSLEADGTISGTGMNSLNHYAYGSVCEAVYSRIMGLRNGAPGWKKAVIAPKLDGRIRQASIRFDSPAGRWETGWEIRDDGSVCLELTVPEGAEARVILPDDPERRQETAGPGAHRWQWQPEKDYLHPYSLESRMMDLLDGEKPAALLREKVPGLYYACQGEKNEFRVKRPLEAARIIHADREAVAALDPLLRAITV